MNGETRGRLEIENELLLTERLMERLIAFREKVGIAKYVQWEDSVKTKINNKFSLTESDQYRLWHKFIGSSGQEGQPLFDFPGEYSIQKTIEQLDV